MERNDEIPIRRLPDGSIDIAFYVRRSHRLRSDAFHQAGTLLANEATATAEGIKSQLLRRLRGVLVLSQRCFASTRQTGRMGLTQQR